MVRFLRTGYDEASLPSGNTPDLVKTRERMDSGGELNDILKLISQG